MEREKFSVSNSSLLNGQKAAGQFLLTLKEQHRLTQTSVNFALCQVKTMMSNIVQDVQCRVENELQQHLAGTGVNIRDIRTALNQLTLLKDLKRSTCRQTTL